MRTLKIKPRFALILLAVAVIGAAVLTFSNRCIHLSGVELLSIPVADLARGQAQTYCYDDRAGEKIRFVLARDSDGKIHSVFDACRQCYSFHKGYRVVGSAIVCRLCGNRYPIDHMMQGKASCMPVELPHQEQAGVVQVKAADLRKGKELF
jgi:uncharacterized membrane protein